MATYTLQQARKVWSNRAKEVRKIGNRSSFAAAKHMIAVAKSLAPRDSGMLQAGIRKRKTRNGYTVESWVPGPFKYNHWVNQSKGYKSLFFPKGAWIPASKSRSGRATRILPPGARAVYGSVPNWSWTGTAGYFTKATTQTRRFFNKGVRRNTRKALRVSV